MDKETAAIFSAGEALRDLIGSKGWEIAKQKLTDKINLLNSISSTVFENKTAEQIASEMRERASVVEILTEWIKDIEGTAAQASANTSSQFESDEIVLVME